MNFSNRVPGICDRCGQRYRLNTLREEYYIGKPTGRLVCRKCWDVSHPQLDTRGIKTNDKQSVKNSRSDSPELVDSRRLFGWNPVGASGSGVIDTSSGRVTVTT